MITFANLGSSANPDINDATDATSYANSSWTPPTSGLIVLFVVSRHGSGLNGPPTVSGNSLTWTQIATMTFQSGNSRITLFAANANGSTAGVTTVSFGSDTQLYCAASFFHAVGVDLNAGVAAAFVQTPSASGTGTSGSVTLAAGNSRNRPIACFAHAMNEVVTPRANWTEADDLAGPTPTRGIDTQWRDDSFEETASASWATSDNWGGLAAELKAVVYGYKSLLGVGV